MNEDNDNQKIAMKQQAKFKAVYADEISLFDVVKIFIKHQKAFWLGFVLILIAGTVFMLSKPKYVSISQSVYLPYSLNSVGQPNYLLTDQTLVGRRSPYQAPSVAFWQYYNGLKNTLMANGFDVTLTLADGSLYTPGSFDDIMNFPPDHFVVSGRVLSSKAVQRQQVLHRVIDRWLVASNAVLSKQKSILAVTVKADKKDLAQLSNEHNYGSTYASVSWADLSQTIRNREVILANWHNFSLGQTTIAPAASKYARHLAVIIFLSVFFGVFLVVLQQLRVVWREESAKSK